MIWTVKFTRDAEKQLARIRGRDRDRLISAIERLSIDPYAGDIKALRGYEGKSYRRRIGNWWIIYTVYVDEIVVEIEEIIRRSSTTYS